MMKIESLIRMFSISYNDAERIVETQTDLGGLSKYHMLVALSGKDEKEKVYDDFDRLRFFNRLDNLTQFIVYSVLDGYSTGSIEDHFGYIRNQLEKI